MAVTLNPFAAGVNRAERFVEKAAAVATTGDTLFTIAGGPIRVTGLLSYCVAANDQSGASTFQYSHDPTDGAAATFSGASSSLAAIVAGGSVSLQGTALDTALTVTVNGPVLSQTREIVLMPGIITLTVGASSPTLSTWKHYLSYVPLSPNSLVY